MEKIKTIVAVSSSTDALTATKSIYQKLNHPDINFVLFYCSTIYILDELAQAMTLCFNDNIDIVGCTTAGEITRDGYKQHSLVAIGFSSKYFSFSSQLIESINKFAVVDALTTINELTEKCRSKGLVRIKNNTFLLTLLDGLSSKEEQFLLTLNSATGEIPHFGGSAGDDINLANTHLFYQNQFYQQAAIVIMVNTKCPFQVFSCNHVAEPGEKLVVTDADADTRTIYELNANPAASEYAKLLKLDVKDLTPDVFALYPLAVKVGGQYYIRSIKKCNIDDLSLTFYCAVDVGIVLTFVEMDEILNPLSNQLEDISERLGMPELVLACDCFLRRLEIEQKNLCQQTQQLYDKYNVVGFNTYGEHIKGIHLNQTFTGVFIAGDCPSDIDE